MSAPGTSAGPARLALVGALALLAACDGGPTTVDGRAHPAQLALAITLQSEPGGGGEGDAYDAANFVRIRLQGGGTVLFDQVAPFEPAAETRVPISVQVQDDTPAELDVTLLRDLSPLFTGSASLRLVPNEVVAADLTLVPVAASISVPESLPTLSSLGETVTLPGNVLFVTGDVASSLHLQWTSLTPAIVTVQTNGSSSSVVAVRSGQGLLQAAFPPFTSNVLVKVEIVAASVEVLPASSTLPIGETVQLTATARDALGNPIPEAAATWSSSDPSVASVGEAGLVLGIAKGTATIRATVGSATGEATVEVVAPLPTVDTEPASEIGVFTAKLHATVSAKGSPATAWFRYGTDAALGTASETPHVDIGSGEAEMSLDAEVDGLDPATTYYFRAVASNDGGEREGDVESFVTRPLAPPSVATLEPSPVTSTAARLVATVDPRGTTTLAHFEWGTDPALATPIVTPDVTVAGGLAEQQIDETITGLKPEGQIYYFRVVGTNDAGTARSAIRSFRTAPVPPSGFYASYDPPTVYMGWTDNSSSETYTSVERSVVSPSAGFVEITEVPAGGEGSTYAADSAPFPAKTLYYRVRACNGFACSEPSNVETVTVPEPTIVGTFYICYSAGTGSCDYPFFPVKVDLLGPSGTVSTNTDDYYGYYYFDPVPVGTYTVRIGDASCSFDVRVNQRSITVGWGERATVDFYADTILCISTGGASTRANPFDPVVSALLGLDADGAPSPGPSPR
jgi:uncharacterized protein YjdB